MLEGLSVNLLIVNRRHVVDVDMSVAAIVKHL